MLVQEGLHATIGGSVGGVILMVLVIIAVVIMLRRRRYAGYSSEIADVDCIPSQWLTCQMFDIIVF